MDRERQKGKWKESRVEKGFKYQNVTEQQKKQTEIRTIKMKQYIKETNTDHTKYHNK